MGPEPGEIDPDLDAVHDQGVDFDAQGDPPGEGIHGELREGRELRGPELVGCGRRSLDVFDIGDTIQRRNPVNVAAEEDHLAGRGAQARVKAET